MHDSRRALIGGAISDYRVNGYMKTLEFTVFSDYSGYRLLFELNTS